MPDTKKRLSAQEAGAFIQRRRKALKYTQEQFIELVGINHATYLSALENGRYDVGNSEYFPAIAKALRLTEEEIADINPDLIVTVTPTSNTPEAPGLNPTYDYREEGLELPESLKVAIERYGDDFPEFKDPEWQQSLAGVRFRGEPIDTPREWLEYLQFALKVLNKRKR